MKEGKRVLFLDCGMGAAGDMLSAALYDLLPDEKKDYFKAFVEAMGLPEVRIQTQEMVRSGISGTSFRVLINGREESTADVHAHHHEHTHDAEHGHEHLHEHTHDAEHGHEHLHEHAHDAEHGHTHGSGHEEGHSHHHSHEHHSMEEIRGIICSLRLPAPVISEVLRIYETIAEAESSVHKTAVSEIHLHEVGMLDAIADITCVCLLLHLLGVDSIISSPVTTGYGFVNCAHGTLPVPAPATALLLKGVPTRAGEIEGELCTPTGAALISHFAGSFANGPAMVTERIGYGFGKKEFSRLNCVRAFLGREEALLSDTDNAAPLSLDSHKNGVAELSCNIDDMTGEELGFAAETLLEEGALDVWMTPIQMKKMRPAVLLSLLCPAGERERFVRLLFRLTSTIGIRESLHERYVLERSSSAAETPWGPVRVKTSSGYGVTRAKAEYDDLIAIARRENRTLEEIRKHIKELPQ